MLRRVVLCYGDSNTWGFDPATGGRFPPDVRWPGMLAAQLGDGWHVIEEGLPGRTTVFDDPFDPPRNGRPYLEPCLLSHEPIDVLVLFLGTNDLSPRFTRTAEEIARGLAVLVRIAGDVRYRAGSAPPVLVLGLPRLGRFEDADLYPGVTEKAERLPQALRLEPGLAGVELLELHEVAAYVDGDGFHLDADGHRAVGDAVARRIAGMF
jgi:lysophospholipase L1-like esterase